MPIGIIELLIITSIIALTALPLILAATLFLETAASFLPGKTVTKTKEYMAARKAILMPAHNEALVIGDTVRNLIPHLSEQDRLIVIADNCDDQTAAIAKEEGAETIIRENLALRGKGYALDFGMSHLSKDPPQIVVIVDADCGVDPHSLDRISSHALETGRPVQAKYDLELPKNKPTNYLTTASLAWDVKNFVRALGLKRLGLPCQLMGTGMAFPWHVIASANLKTGNIVEDLALGLELAKSGKAPIFMPEARVYSVFPESDEGQKTQRERWERGHLDIIMNVVPGLLWHGLKNANLQLLALALDAAIPPLSFLLMTILATTILGATVAITGSSIVPLILAITSMGLFAGAVFLSTLRLGKSNYLYQLLGQIPRYAVSKLVLYANAFLGKPVQWMRSKRD